MRVLKGSPPLSLVCSPKRVCVSFKEFTRDQGMRNTVKRIALINVYVNSHLGAHARSSHLRGRSERLAQQKETRLGENQKPHHAECQHSATTQRRSSRRIHRPLHPNQCRHRGRRHRNGAAGTTPPIGLERTPCWAVSAVRKNAYDPPQRSHQCHHDASPRSEIVDSRAANAHDAAATTPSV